MRRGTTTALGGPIRARAHSAGQRRPARPAKPVRARQEPATLCGPGIEVVPATLAECPAGGIVIIIIRGDRDTDPKRKPATPPTNASRSATAATALPASPASRARRDLRARPDPRARARPSKSNLPA